MKTSYTFTVLRYVHDATTGEFVNVGVALFAPGANYLDAICRTTYGRITRVFPGTDGERFKSVMRYIRSSFEKRGAQMQERVARGEFEFEQRGQSVMDYALEIVPRDDSSLQWAPMGSGITDDPASALKKIYSRMVERYEADERPSGRNDEAVWKSFRNHLAQEHVLTKLEPKTIVSGTADDQVDFKYAWKNSAWHCLEPISFDLLEADSIKKKAHLWLGQVSSIQDSPEPFTVYLLLGEPQISKLKPALTTAENILNKIPVSKVLVREHESAAFARHLATKIRKHDDEEESRASGEPR